MPEEIALDVETDEPPESTLIVGFPGPGMAGVSANQYLIEQLALEETGHVQAEGLPAITPYVDGRPYHHTRLFSSRDVEFTLLVSELPVPIQLSEPFGRILLEWIDERDVDEVTLLTAIPSLESFEELFYVASADYYEHRLADRSISALRSGFLTGVNASLTARAMDTELRVGVLATSIDPRQPLDGEAVLRLVEGLDRIYGLDVETDELRQFAERTREHYEELAARVESQQRAEDRRRTEDYGFM